MDRAYLPGVPKPERARVRAEVPEELRPRQDRRTWEGPTHWKISKGIKKAKFLGDSSTSKRDPCDTWDPQQEASAKRRKQLAEKLLSKDAISDVFTFKEEWSPDFKSANTSIKEASEESWRHRPFPSIFFKIKLCIYKEKIVFFCKPLFYESQVSSYYV